MSQNTAIVYTVKDETTGLYLCEPDYGLFLDLGDHTKIFLNIGSARGLSTRKNNQVKYLNSLKPGERIRTHKIDYLPDAWVGDLKKSKFSVAAFALIPIDIEEGL